MSDKLDELEERARQAAEEFRKAYVAAMRLDKDGAPCARRAYEHAERLALLSEQAEEAFHAALVDEAGEDDDEYGCAHCGTETEVLDAEGLCAECARAQQEFDDGECPHCGCPSPGSRECHSC